MTPDQTFARWVKVAIVAFIVLFIYFLVADSFMPMTPEARVMRPVTRIAPELSGPVDALLVRDHQRVAKGDVLFQIEAAPFALAVDQARLNREQAERENARLEADLASAQADLASAEATASESQSERRRAETLLSRQSVSRQQYDQQVAAERTAQASVAAARAKIVSLEVQLGDSGNANLRVRQAENALSQAQLDLAHTQVRAAQSGNVTNLQLGVGDYVQAGQPAVAVVAEEVDIIADFREKSLRHVVLGDPAKVIFDAWPGQVFDARVIAVDAGVREGQLAADGQLADIPTSDRWIRDAQRMRVHIALQQPVIKALPSGARATVQLQPSDFVLAKPFGWLQAHLISLLHYVY